MVMRVVVVRARGPLNLVADTPARSTLIGVDVRSRRAQAAERALQLVERQAGVEERAERHVAGDAGKAVEIRERGSQVPRSP